MLLAATVPSSSENGNPPWLVEIHSKLWGRRDLFNKIFRLANLTKMDFIKLQLLLEGNDSSRSSPTYEAQNVLNIKADFLRKQSSITGIASAISEYDATCNHELVPSVITSASDPLAGWSSTLNANLSKADSTASNLALQFPNCPGYILADAVELSGMATVFPCIIRYMDLTALKLEYLTRVPHLMLIRDEWQTMINIFNRREGGVSGSAAFIGSPGIGEHYFKLTLGFNQDHHRQNLHSVLHPNPLPHPSSASCVSRHEGACFLHYR